METLLIIHLEDEADRVRDLPDALLRKIRLKCRKHRDVISLKDDDHLESSNPWFAAEFSYSGKTTTVEYRIVEKDAFEQSLDEHLRSHKIIFALMDWRHHEKEVSFGVYKQYESVLSDFDWVFLTGWPQEVIRTLPGLDHQKRVHSKLAYPNSIVERMLDAIIDSIDPLTGSK